MRIFEVVTPSYPTNVLATIEMINDYNQIIATNEAWKNKLQDFITSKLTGDPVNLTKDDPFKYLKGLWHYHISTGKLMLVYNKDLENLYLYKIVTHKDYDTVAAARRLTTYCDNKLKIKDFVKLDLNSFLGNETEEYKFDPGLKTKLDDVIYDLINSNAFEVFRPALENSHWNELIGYFNIEIDSLDPKDIFLAYGGEDELKKFITESIKQYGKTEEYKAAGLKKDNEEPNEPI